MDENNKTVSLNEVISRIAALSNVDEETSRDFMMAFSKVLTEALLNKDSVDIRAIGRFSEDEHVAGSVKFEASLPLASVVNRPFSCFDPVELDCSEEELTLQVVDNQGEGTLQNSAPEILPPLPLEIQQPEDESTEENQVEESNEPEMAIVEHEPEKIEPIEPDEVVSEVENAVPVDTGPATVKIDNRKPLQVEIVGGEEPKKRHPLTGWIFSLGLVIGVCIGFVAGLFLHDYIFPTDLGNYIAEDVDPEFELVDSMETVVDPVVSPASQSDSTLTPDESITASPVPVESNSSESVTMAATPSSVVTDTVAPGRFLASMARKHYGSFVFWVYIYEENRDKISNPDNVAVGTVVVIPDASKYGIDASSPESIKKAKAKAAEIAASKR